MNGPSSPLAAKLLVSELNPAGAAEYAEAMVIASPLDGLVLVLSEHAAMSIVALIAAEARRIRLM